MASVQALPALWALLATWASGAAAGARHSAGGFIPVRKHQLTHVPGFKGSELPSRHFTGHIPVRGGQHLLWYWLVESEYNAVDDPVMLWLTGGPGCSSMDAFIYEHGPFTFQMDPKEGEGGGDDEEGDIRLVPNPWSWSKAATVVYVDSPVGTGLSYVDGHDQREDVHTDDQQTTDDLLEVLVALLTRDHPHLLDKDLYIAGESYGGVYVPLLASKVQAHNERAPASERLRLVGYAVGNGVTDDQYDGDGQPEFAYSMGLIDPATFKHLQAACNNSFWNASAGSPCAEGIKRAYDRFYWLNPYDILADCYVPGDAHPGAAGPAQQGQAADVYAHPRLHGPEQQQQSEEEALGMRSGRVHGAGRQLRTSLLAESQMLLGLGPQGRHGPAEQVLSLAIGAEDRRQARRAHVGKLTSRSGGVGGKWRGWPIKAALQALASAPHQPEGVQGQDRGAMLAWPLAGVRRAQQPTPGQPAVRNWRGLVGHSVPCGDRRVALSWFNREDVRSALHAPPTEQLDWQPCSDHVSYSFVAPLSMLPLHKQALEQGLRVLIYSGDHDFVVPFTGTRAWVYNAMNLTVASPHGPWMVDSQVAGFRATFQEGLTFATVKGAGHMVPQTNPDKALHLLLRFLDDRW